MTIISEVIKNLSKNPDGLTLKEISEKIGKTVACVYNAMYRIRNSKNGKNTVTVKDGKYFLKEKSLPGISRGTIKRKNPTIIDKLRLLPINVDELPEQWRLSYVEEISKAILCVQRANAVVEANNFSIKNDLVK